MKISRDEICNGCTSLQFGAKKCLKFNTVLNTFTNSEGYISVFPCAICGRNDYTPRAQRKEKPMENKMNQQQKLKAAKDLTKERFKDFVGDCIQIDDYKWASLEEVNGEEIWVVFSLTAKKNFDIDDAVEDWNDKLKMRSAQ